MFHIDDVPHVPVFRKYKFVDFPLKDWIKFNYFLCAVSEILRNFFKLGWKIEKFLLKFTKFSKLHKNAIKSFEIMLSKAVDLPVRSTGVQPVYLSPLEQKFYRTRRRILSYIAIAWIGSFLGLYIINLFVNSCICLIWFMIYKLNSHN